VIDATQKVKIAEVQIEQLKRANKHAKLTDQELGTLPEDTKTYESIGRM
jgi:prefoldin subunit 1